MISRRRFLLAAVAVSAAASGAYMAKPYVRKRLLPERDTTYPLGVLQGPEIRTIVALGETVSAPESLPPPEFFQDYANWVTQSQPGFLKEHQRAVLLLNQVSASLFSRGGAAKRFEGLPLSRRDQVLQTLLWRYLGSDLIAPKLEKLVASRDALALRIYVMEPLIEHYYRSPYGWAVVGYRTFPGRPPLDPRDYTRPLDSA